MSALRDLRDKIGISGELFAFLWRNKLWWMYPVVFVLVVLGALIVVGTTSGVGPFIYTIF